MNYIDYLVILIFTVIIIISGISFSRSGSSMKSYFAAGGAVPWQVNGLSLFMSFFSAGTFVAWGSLAYTHGLVAITIQLMMCIGGFFVGLLIAPAWRKTGVLTVAEFIRKRLGNKTQKFYTYLLLIMSLFYTGAFLYPVAKIVNIATELPIEWCIVLLGGLIIVYTTIGGLWAVIITDVLQFVILTAAVLLLVPLILDKVGGFENFVAQAPQNFFHWTTDKEFTPLFLISYIFYNIIFIGGNWAYVQRYTSVKTVKSSKKVGYLFSALYLISPIIWMLPPMLYRVIDQGVLTGLEAENAYLMACKSVLPIGMLGLMIGAMIFATASSVNTILNLSSAIVTNDLFRPLRPKASLKQLMFVAKFSTLIFGIGAIVVALFVPYAGGIVEVVISLGAITGCSLYAPPIWTLFSKRQTGKSILTVTILSLIINIGLKLGILGYELSREKEMLFGVIIPFFFLIISEFWLAYRGIKIIIPEKLDSCKEEISKENIKENVFGFRVLSNALIAIGVLILLISIVSDREKRGLIIIGCIILVISMFLNPKFDPSKKMSQLIKKKPKNEDI